MTAGTGPDAGALEQVAARLDEERLRHGIPGAAVAVCTSAGPVWTASCGVADEHGRPIGVRTRWSLQSQSKMYTAAAVLLAVQDGMLDLDAPITRYLPGFTVRSLHEPDPADRLTLRHLLGHTAGFTHEAPEGSNYRIGSASFDRHCASIRDTWLRFPVCHHYDYSNLGIDLAGEIVATVSGRPFAVLMRERLLGPIGAETATFVHRRLGTADEPAARGFDNGHPQPRHVPMLGSGGLWASVTDASRLATLHLARGGTLLAPELLDEQYAVPLPASDGLGNGLGIVTRRVDGVLYRGHSGGGFGFLSDTYWAPEHDIGVALVTNSEDHPVQQKLVFDLLRLLLGDRVAGGAATLVRRDPPPRHDEVPAALAGEYVSRHDSVRVELDGSRASLVENGSRHQLGVVGGAPLTVVDETGSAYRALPLGDHGFGCLERVADGHTRYRNEEPSLVGDAHTTVFRVRKRGRAFGTATLTSAGDLGIFAFRDEPPVRVEQVQPGRWFAAHGELLDLTAPRPSYANIPLTVT
jgi:CubicO group peptidase (beta-lactamase class C family)